VKHCDGNYLIDSEELKSRFRDNFLAQMGRAFWAILISW
jgi:hypothetical protein